MWSFVLTEPCTVTLILTLIHSLIGPSTPRTFRKTSTHPTRSRVQNLVLVWVDADIDPNDSDTLNQLDKLRSIVNDIFLTQQSIECTEFLRGLDTEKAIVISSDSLGQELVPKIHSMINLDTICIFSNNQKFQEHWSKQWTKIRGVHSEIDDLCKTIQLAVREINQDSIPVSFIDVDKDGSSTDLNRLEPSFMYTHLLKDTLLNMKHPAEEFQKLVDMYRIKFRDNLKESKTIDEFARTYSPDKAIWWYTRDCFIYQMLNRALRLLEGDTIVDMGFFIHDLHQQLGQLHKAQLDRYGGKPFIVHRGQGFTEENFAKLQKNKGGLLGFNCFLSTSKDRSKSLKFAKNGATKSGMVGILFIITIDPNLTQTPFADISDISFYPNEAEILFAMHTVFRIGQIQAVKGYNGFFEVHLSLTRDDDPQLKALTTHLNHEMGGSGWEKLAFTLIDIGQVNKAEELYLALLEKASSESERASHSHSLGLVKDRQGNYQEAIQYYEQALSIQKKVSSTDDPNIASTYNQIGQAYMKEKKYIKALAYYEQALAIDKKNLPNNHPDLAASYSNLGGAYNRLEQYSEALFNYEQALAIQKRTLPENHPSLATSYNNLGVLYKTMENYPEALSNYTHALDIREKTLPENHPSLATSYNNIAVIYESMKEYSKALPLYQKALLIKEQAFPLNHPGIESARESINLMKEHLGLSSK